MRNAILTLDMGHYLAVGALAVIWTIGVISLFRRLKQRHDREIRAMYERAAIKRPPERPFDWEID